MLAWQSATTTANSSIASILPLFAINNLVEAHWIVMTFHSSCTDTNSLIHNPFSKTSIQMLIEAVTVWHSAVHETDEDPPLNVCAIYPPPRCAVWPCAVIMRAPMWVNPTKAAAFWAIVCWSLLISSRSRCMRATSECRRTISCFTARPHACTYKTHNTLHPTVTHNSKIHIHCYK